MPRRASSRARLHPVTVLILDHLHAGARGPDFKLLDGGGAKCVGGAEQHGAIPCARYQAASLPLEVVLPVPLTPTRKVTLGASTCGGRRAAAGLQDGAQLLFSRSRSSSPPSMA
jgi:hypothetical protein